MSDQGLAGVGDVVREQDPAGDSEVDYIDDEPQDEFLPIDVQEAEEIGANLDDPDDFVEDDIGVVQPPRE